MSAEEPVTDDLFEAMINAVYKVMIDAYEYELAKNPRHNEDLRRRQALQRVREQHRSAEHIAGFTCGDRAELFCMARRYDDFRTSVYDSSVMCFVEWFQEDYHSYFKQEFKHQLETDTVTQAISAWSINQVASFLASEIAFQRLVASHKAAMVAIQQNRVPDSSGAVSTSTGANDSDTQSVAAAPNENVPLSERATIQQATMMIYYLLTSANVDIGLLTAASVQRLVVWLTGANADNVRKKVDEFIRPYNRNTSKQAVQDLTTVQSWLETVSLRSTGIADDIDDMTEKLERVKRM